MERRRPSRAQRLLGGPGMPWDLRSLESPPWPGNAALTVALSTVVSTRPRQILRYKARLMNGKRLTNLVYRFATRTRQNLRRVHYRLPEQPTVKGMRMVVALDGGPAHCRQNKPGKRRKSRRHGYHGTALARAQACCASTPLTRTARSRKNVQTDRRWDVPSYWRNHGKSSTG